MAGGRLLWSAAVAVVVAASSFAAAAPAPDDPASGAGGRQRIQVLGEATSTIYVARSGGLWSVWSEGVPAGELLMLLEEAGGPSHTTLGALDHPVTLAVHSEPFSRVLERILYGHSFSLHYSGRDVRHVRVLNPIQGREYRPARRTESRADWTKIELGLEAGTDED